MNILSDPDLLGGKFSVFSLSGIMLVVILYRESFIKLRKFLLLLFFLRVLSKMSVELTIHRFASINMIFLFNLLIWWISLIIKLFPGLAPPGTNPTWSYLEFFYITEFYLLIFCQEFYLFIFMRHILIFVYSFFFFVPSFYSFGIRVTLALEND